LQNNPQYGLVGPRLLAADGKIQTVCARPLLSPVRYALTLLLLDLGLPTGKFYDAYRRRRLQHQGSGPVPCLSGACLLAAHETLNQLGLLDEGYDFYFEDVEWCHRVQKSGRLVAYIAEASVTHLGDRSLAKVKVWAKQSEYRSALRYFRQYYRLSLWQARSIWLVTMLSFLMRLILFKIGAMLSGRPGYTNEYSQLLRWICLRYPVAVHATDVVLTGQSNLADVSGSDRL
jgi:GT2 family glycosyltransferase